MKYFRIKNYERYQSKKPDRNTLPWIMLQKKLINDWSYGELLVSEKLMFIHMLLIADSVSNKFPVDARWMRTKLQVKAKWNFETFERLGFIEIIGTNEKPDKPSRRENIHPKDINQKEKRGKDAEPDPPPLKNFPDRDPGNKPDVQSCLTHYEAEYLRLFKNRPMIFGLNDTRKLNPVVAQFGVEETNNLITRYLETQDDELVAKRGWPICLFPSAINKLLIARAQELPDASPPELKKVAPPPGVPQDQVEKWQKCMDQIECAILPDNFKTLFETMAFAGISNDIKAGLICGSKSHADCMEKNYKGLLKETMSDVFGMTLKPVFSLCE